MRVAVLFNPGAGNNEKFIEIGKLLTERLVNHEVYTCPGSSGGFYLTDAIKTGDEIYSDYKNGIKRRVLLLASCVPELFICVGGDGLAAYVADALISGGFSIPIMGIAGGTANVGPIVSVKSNNLRLFNPENIELTNAGAIRVTSCRRHIGYGFNDVVIGNTFLGTIDGKVANISVEALLKRNEKSTETPSGNITDNGFRIIKNNKPVEFKTSNPAQIIVSPLEADRFYGRAITGALCYSAYLQQKAAIALSDRILVSIDSGDAGIGSFLEIEHLLFGPGDKVSIEGLAENGHIIIDGNPYLRENENVIFEYLPNLVRIARPSIITV